MEFSLPTDVRLILSRLHNAGHNAHIVGGPVRDFLLGKPPHDFDITTDATPPRVEEIFSDCRVVETGIKHGTVSILIGGACYEVTTYRVDGEYKDARHPESVSFTTELSEDLSRRDFTMNAIAYSPKDGICDPFGGRVDIAQRTIRAVGDPEKRFSEDALRILRAIRFSATLGFGIEENTKRAIFAKRHLLSKVSAERIYAEWQKMLSGDFAYDAVAEYRDVIAEFLPELAKASLSDASAFAGADYLTRMLSLFFRSKSSPETYEAAMRRLRTDSHTAKVGASVLSAIGKYESKTNSEIGMMLMRFGAEVARYTLSTQKLLGISDDDAQIRLESYIALGSPYRISDLEINGEDLLSLGICGRAIGDTLSKLLHLVIEGAIQNEKNKLMLKARQLSEINKKSI